MALIQGHLVFVIDQIPMEFRHQNISTYGVTGLPWSPLDPLKHFAREVAVKIETATPRPIEIRCPAFLVRERTTRADYLGVKFLLPQEDKDLLQDQLDRFGKEPTQWKRKYPRISSRSKIETFPMRVLATPFERANSKATLAPFICDISNLGPQGILVHTENPTAVALQPGQHLHLQIEPRGNFSVPIRVQGKICRILDELNLENRNRVRYFGIQFSKIDPENRASYLSLLKDILGKLQGKIRS